MGRRFSNYVICSWIVCMFLSTWLLAACTEQEEQVQKLTRAAALPQSPLVKAVEPPKGQVDLRTAIVRVAEQTIPAVAHIEVTQRQEVATPFSPFENDPFFRYFFNFPDEPRKFKRELKGLGTGMVMDEEGHILTNNHVVGGATEIKVLLSNGKQYPAKVVGTDPKTDLAVIKIETTETLPHVTFGDSDKVEVGEWVVAIGHPRGLDQTVTQGIISAKHRRGITDPSTYQDFLQTDAAINPGNSGGPLLNLQGEVIGVNAAIVSQSGGSEGIGFAIPSNMALHTAKALIAHGKVERGWLGVSVQDLTPDLAQSFGLGAPKGALIADVSKDGPADKAGIKRGDVVLAYKGKETPDSSTLRNEIANTPIGEEVKVTVWRDGKQEEVSVKIGSLEDATKLLSASLKDRLGGEFQPVTSKEVEKYHLESQQGVVVVWLDPKGALAEAGFEVGDMIFAINGQAIESMESFVNLMNTVPPHQRITLLVLDYRRGNTGYVQVVVR
ncbi:MAG: DegQ family serine endoprotease [Pseudomonadota bacterium]